MEWRKDDQLITNQGRHTLNDLVGSTSSVGSNGILRGSQISELQITDLQETDNGVFFCSSSNETLEIFLHVGEFITCALLHCK